jgi:hypothetical protein
MIRPLRRAHARVAYALWGLPVLVAIVMWRRYFS